MSGSGDLAGGVWRALDRGSAALYLVLLLAVFGVMRPDLFTLGSASSVIQLSTPLLVVATGMTFCLVCGEVDLSVAGIAGLASTVAALAMDAGWPWPVAVLLALALGAGIGMANGALVAWVARSFPRYPSFLVTIATAAMALGAAQAIQPAQQAVAITNAGFQALFGSSAAFGGGLTTWYALAVVLAAHVVLTRSCFGYTLTAVGTNARAATLIGIRVIRTKFWVLTLSGLLAAFAGLCEAGFVQAGFFGVARGIEVDAIAAAVIGGTSLQGGRGSVIGTIAGVLILGILNTGLLILQAPVNQQLISKGCLVVLALAASQMLRRRAAQAYVGPRRLPAGGSTNDVR